MKSNIPYRTFSYTIPIPGGAKAAIHITEIFDVNEPKEWMIQCNIGKAGTDVAAWSNALSKMTAMALVNTSLDEVIATLSDIATDRFVMTSKGESCRSGPEAFAIALRLYRGER